MTWVVITAALAVAIAALRRSRAATDLADRVAALEKELAALRRSSAAGEKVSAAVASSEDAAAPAADAVTVEEATPSGRAAASVATAAVDPWRPRSERVAAPPPAVSMPARSAASLGIDWEQWLGVRGAAVLGGVVLALAGLFFFRYSIEHGLLPPWLRVVLGTLAGVSCLATSERYLRRDYAGTANALVGAGVVILYSAFWAAHGLYGLVAAPVSFVLMALVTATCAAFSWRQSSVVIALIGLVGGFLTPLLLSSGSDRPIALFSYVLLLDAGLLYLARQRRWSVLPLVGLAATFLYLAAWIVLRMGPQRLPLGLVLTSLFGALFVLAPRPDADARQHWLLARIGGAVLPFAFALHFALDARLGARLYPIVLSLLPLALAAGWLSEVHRRWALASGAAAASLAVVVAWMTTRRLDAALAWEISLLMVVLAAVFHVFVERRRAAATDGGPLPAALVSAAGGFALLAAAAVLNGRIAVWPWLCGWVALAGLLMRQGAVGGRAALPQSAAAAALALAVASTQMHWGAGFPGPRTYVALVVGLACALQYVAVRPSPLRAGVASERAALVFALLASWSLVGVASGARPPLLLIVLGAATLGFLAVLAATRAGAAPWYATAMLTTAAVHGVAIGAAGTLRENSPAAALLLAFAAGVFFTFWPLLAAPPLRAARATWYAAAFALPMWFWTLRRIFLLLFGGGAIGVLPIALGAVSLAAAVRVRAVLAAEDRMRGEAFAWYVVVALGFAAVAIPLQLSKEWITLGWALEGTAAVWLWKRYELPALKYFGLALLGAATVRLIGNPAVLGYYARPRFRIVNWLAYTYLIPAACLLWSASLLAALEVQRARGRERVLYSAGQPVGAIAAALAGLVVVFVWLNLAIADWFSSGPTLTVSFARLPARDLTTSVVWAAYALALLAAGVRLASRGMRWASLALLSLTLVKVFLYDVGELRDLYRVASLLGLALSLIIVSLVYQRFVFRVAEKR